MPDFVYPTNAELQLIRQVKEPVLLLGDPIFRELPVVNVDAAILSWEQMDDFVGLQGVRGIGGQPGRVAATGGKRFTVVPGYYGEFMTIDEVELTTRRPYGAFSGPVNIADLVAMRQDQLLNRRIDRWRYTGWTLLGTGTFSATTSDGQVVHTDTYSLQTFSAGTAWSTVATATPLANLRAIKLLGRGKGVSFGRQARLYLNQKTANDLLNNTNANDLGGKRVVAGNTLNSLDDINRILASDDLPQIVVYDEGYYDDTGTFQLFIADGKGVLVGQRGPGQPVGDMAATRNANNPNMEPGPYTKVVDNGDRAVPRVIEVHDGANFAPRVYYPGSIVRLNV